MRIRDSLEVAATNEIARFGPFASTLAEPRRRARLHERRALAFLPLGARHPMVGRLAAAESDRPPEFLRGRQTTTFSAALTAV